MRFLVLILQLTLLAGVHGQPKTDTLLTNMLSGSSSSIMKQVLANKDEHRLQIIYTQISRDAKNKPSFQNYYFNVSDQLYFNPASTVKLPLALLSLEKLNTLGKKDIDKYTSMQFDSSFLGQVKSFEDNTSEDSLPSIAHYIKKAFLVSDNDAYNRMYQFVGQQTINDQLQSKGYANTRITRQFMGFSEEQNRNTNQIRFLSKDGQMMIYTQPPAYNSTPFTYDRIVKIGKGHLNRNDSLINEPIDFTKANVTSLNDLQRMLQSVMFPMSIPSKQRFNLSSNDYAFLHQYLSQYPSETNYPKYDTSEYYDSYVKFYFRNESHKMPPQVRVFNKVGWAYGFLIDVSYVVDFKNQVEFMLTTTLYTNSDGILNDNKYEYETVGWPFLYSLGQTVYQYEIKRKRVHQPNLSDFKIKYENRNPLDQRETIKNVDN